LSGFVSSGFSVGKGAGPGGAFAMAIVGGTASELGGGKFSNGAVTAIYVHLFNSEGIISSTIGAVGKYFRGNGGMVELGDATKNELRNNPRIRNQSIALRNGTAKHLSGNLSIDLTGDTFHVGDTGVVFNTLCSGTTCTTGYVGFINCNISGGSVATSLDGFSDPFDLGFELPGGTPYVYVPYSWSETYENKF